MADDNWLSAKKKKRKKKKKKKKKAKLLGKMTATTNLRFYDLS